MSCYETSDKPRRFHLKSNLLHKYCRRLSLQDGNQKCTKDAARKAFSPFMHGALHASSDSIGSLYCGATLQIRSVVEFGMQQIRATGSEVCDRLRTNAVPTPKPAESALRGFFCVAAEQVEGNQTAGEESLSESALLSPLIKGNTEMNISCCNWGSSNATRMRGEFIRDEATF